MDNSNRYMLPLENSVGKNLFLNLDIERMGNGQPVTQNKKSVDFGNVAKYHELHRINYSSH